MGRQTSEHDDGVGVLSPSRWKLASAALGLVFIVTSVGCSEGELLEVLVCGELVESDTAEAVRVSFLDDALIEQKAAVFELATVTEWPAQTAIEVERDSGWVRATAIVGGAPSARFDRRISEIGRISVILDPQCVGQMCARGQSCIAGTCTVAPADDQAPNCEFASVVGP